MLGAAAHELDAVPAEAAQGALGGRMNIPSGQDAEPQHVRQVGGVGFVVAAFQAVVLFHGDGVGEFDRVARSHQAIDQPVPVIGGLDDHGREFALARRKQREYLREIVGTAAADQYLVSFVRRHHNAIVGMQVYAAESHLDLLRVKNKVRNLAFYSSASQRWEVG